GRGGGRVAASRGGDLKAFGLDRPGGVGVLKAAGKPVGTVKVGKAVEGGAAGERYALVDDGKAVLVLAAPLARELLAPAVNFRDRTPAQFPDADKVKPERHRPKATLTP